MITVQLRLSNKRDKTTGKSEVLFRISRSSSSTLRGKSGLLVSPKHFQYYIDRKKCANHGINIPVKMITCTKEEAEKRGYFILDKGEVVVTERTMTQDTLADKEVAEKLEKLIKIITNNINERDSAINTSEELQKVIDKFHHPDLYVDTETASLNIYQLMELYLEKKQLSDYRIRSYRVLIRTLWRFESYKKATENESFSIDVEKITRYDLEDFESFMRNEYDLAKENPSLFEEISNSYPDYIVCTRKSPQLERRGDNCIIGLEKRLKSFFNWLYETERTKNRPCDGFKIGTEKYGTPYYITIEERNIIADTDLSAKPWLEVQRDIFVFHCLIGCRVSDLMKLTKENITDGILEYIPSKTKDEYQQVKPRIPLIPRAVNLLKKYEGIDKKGRLFPFISPQKYNVAIKKIFKECGITRSVSVRNPTTGDIETRPINEIASSHLARRTFIGAAYKMVTDPNLVGKMSGHVEGSKAFIRYRNIDDDMLKDVMSKIE